MFPLISRIEPLESRIAPAGIASINVTSLNGSNGLRVDGTGANHFAGTTVDILGDVNSDGFDDFILSESIPPQNDDGRVYVVFGKASGFPAVFSPASLNGTNGFRISDVQGRGSFVTPGTGPAGDVNNDNVDDILVSGGGTAFVIFGKTTGFSADLSVTSLNGTNGFGFGVPSGNFHEEAASAGDVNGDGSDDLIYQRDNIPYVLFGKASGFMPFVDLTTLTAPDGFRIDAPAGNGGLAVRGVSGIGDLNADGFADLAIGTTLFPNSVFDAYVLFGHAGLFAGSVNAAALNGSNGFRLQGTSQMTAGFMVAGGGDINGDGVDDLITSNVVVFGHGSAFSASLSVTALNGANGFTIANGAPDRSVAGAGDFNADGYDDILLNTAGGNASVIFGKAAPFPATVDITQLDGSNGLTIVLPENSNDPTPRRTVGGGGDVNGDGIDDLIVSARTADTNGTDSGAAYIIFGLAPTLNVGDATIAEGVNGTSNATFTVSLSGTLDRAVSVSVSSADGTAVVNEDYDALAVTELTFAPGELTKTVEVAVRGDSKFEPNETFTLNLSNARGAGISDAQGVGTITNDDARPSFTINDISLQEPADGSMLATLAVNLSNPSSETISVTVSTMDGTAVAPGDYEALASTVLTFAPGELAKVVGVQVHADAVFEADETFAVVLSDAVNATIGKAAGQITILNVQAPPAITVADIEVTEGDSANVPAIFTVSLSGPSSSTVSVHYALASGTAQAPGDYLPLEPGDLIFAPGETTKSVTVQTVGNTRDDLDARTFSLQLSEPSGGTIATAAATATILDNDASPTFSISDVVVAEGNNAETFATFTMSLSAASGRTTSVEYATASGTATAGADFTAVTGGGLAFAPGETSKTITVPILGDTLNEPDETFFVNLSAPVNASIQDAQGQGTILDNDSLPTISIADVRLAEGPTGAFPAALFTVSLSAPSGRDVTVAFATQDGTALAGSDYTAVTGTLTIPAGAAQGTVSIPIVGDRTVESTEQFFVTLSAPIGGIVADGIATGTIANDDVLLVTPHLATFTDEDGDLVSVRLTHGKLTVDDFTLALGSGTIGMRLAELSLVGRDGGDLVIKATPQPDLGGNGEVNVGRIDALGTDLIRVKVRGDLGEIDAGWSGTGSVSGTTLTLPPLPPAIGILDVRSMGGQRPSNSFFPLESTLVRGADTILVRGDFTGARLVAIGGDAHFGTVIISGDVDGGDLRGAGLFSHERIGAVVVGGNWRAADIVAGVAAGHDGSFGTADDTLLPNVSGSTIGAIARITIKGGVFGTEASSDYFGFVAESLRKVKIAGAVIPLNPGPRNDLDGIPLGTTGDFRAREVA